MKAWCLLGRMGKLRYFSSAALWFFVIIDCDNGIWLRRLAAPFFATLMAVIKEESVLLSDIWSLLPFLPLVGNTLNFSH